MMDIKKTLKNILFICLLLHICLLLIFCFIFEPLYYKSQGHLLYDDGEAYSVHARIISFLLLNKLPDKHFKEKYPNLIVAEGRVLDYAQKGLIIPADTYQVGYITYFYSLIYVTFGYHPILINIMNILLNLLTGIIIFKICNLVFDERVGCIAMTMFLFNPTLFHYANTKVAESVYIFVIYVFIYCAIRLLQKKMFYILPTGITLLLINLFRQIYFIPMITIFLMYLIINYLLKNKRLGIIYISLLLAISLFFAHTGYLKILNILQRGAYHNMCYQESGGLTYNLLIFGKNWQNYNLVQWVIYFIKAWYHMLFEPIHPNSVLYLLYYPFKIIFLFLCLFAFLGLVISIRLKKKVAILFSMFFITIGSIIALGSGNVGTMLRHRDIITPIVFIFSSVFLRRLIQASLGKMK